MDFFKGRKAVIATKHEKEKVISPILENDLGLICLIPKGLDTDMRAMSNPTRMKVIAKATEKLVSKIKSLCPQCKAPGFGVVDSAKGLPCEMYGRPTGSKLKPIYRYQKCNFIMEKEFPFNKKKEDP